MPVAASPLRFSSGALRQMSNTDINDYVSERIGESFASTESTGSLNTSSGTSIGTLTDNYTVIDASGVVTGSSNISGESILYQNTTLVTPTTPTRPLKYSDVVGGLQQMSDSDIDTYISAVVAKYIADGGVGSYALGLTAPSDGDTWTSRATITNRRALQDSTYTGNVIVGYLWQKTASSSVTIKRPVHYDTSVKEMTDVQIQTLTDRVRNEIVNNSIGTYKISQSAPITGGTWRQCGSGIDDVVTSTYTNVFTGNYTSQYTQQYTSQYTTVWTSTFAAGYTQGYTTAYTQQYTGEYNAVYGSKTWTPSQPATAFFTSTYTGLTYTSEFNAVYTLANEYTTVTVYGNALAYTTLYTGVEYTTEFAGLYTGTIGSEYTTIYTINPTYAFIYAGFYAPVFVGAWTVEYTSAYTNTFTNNPTVSYTAPAPSYAGVYTQLYTRILYWSGPRAYQLVNYVSERYTRIDAVFGGYTNILVYSGYTAVDIVYTDTPYTAPDGQVFVTTGLDITLVYAGTAINSAYFTDAGGLAYTNIAKQTRSTTVYYHNDDIYTAGGTGSDGVSLGNPLNAFTASYSIQPVTFTTDADDVFTGPGSTYTTTGEPQTGSSYATNSQFDTYTRVWTRGGLNIAYTSDTISPIYSSVFNTGSNLYTGMFTSIYSREFTADEGWTRTGTLRYYAITYLSYNFDGAISSYTRDSIVYSNPFLYTRLYTGPDVAYGIYSRSPSWSQAYAGVGTGQYIGQGAWSGETSYIIYYAPAITAFTSDFQWTRNTTALYTNDITGHVFGTSYVSVWTGPAAGFPLYFTPGEPVYTLESYVVRGENFTGYASYGGYTQSEQAYTNEYVFISGTTSWAGPVYTRGVFNGYTLAFQGFYIGPGGIYTGATGEYTRRGTRIYVGPTTFQVFNAFTNVTDGTVSVYGGFSSSQVWQGETGLYTGHNSDFWNVNQLKAVAGDNNTIYYTRGTYTGSPLIIKYQSSYNSIVGGLLSTYAGLIYTGDLIPDFVYVGEYGVALSYATNWSRTYTRITQFGQPLYYANSWTGPSYTADVLVWSSGPITSYAPPFYGLFYRGFQRRYTAGPNVFYTRQPGYTTVLPIYFTSEIISGYFNAIFANVYTGLTYTSEYTGPNVENQYTATYTRDLTYTTVYTSIVDSTYTSPLYTVVFAAPYTNAYTGGYTGEPTYTSALEYTAPLYTAQYIGTWSINFTAGPFTQQFTKLYTSVSDVAYAGIYSNVYTQQYTHTTPVVWTSIYANVYTLAATENYTVAVIDNTYTRTQATYYLWVRIA